MPEPKSTACPHCGETIAGRTMALTLDSTKVANLYRAATALIRAIVDLPGNTLKAVPAEPEVEAHG